MNDYYFSLVFILFSYLLGCISTGYYLVLLFTSKDIRKIGSKSTGATNVGRLLGKKWFFITVALDCSKGILIALLSKMFKYNDFQTLLSILALVCGHIWPVQLRFHGGKGIAVLLSFMFFWNLNMFIIFVLSGLTIYLILREYTISGLLGLLVFPVYSLINQSDYKQISLLILLIIIVYFAHRDNFISYLKKIKK